MPKLPVKILTYGYDAVLLETRRLLLAQAGYHTEVASNPEQLERALEMVKEPYDVLVICHTVPVAEQ